MIFGLSRPPLGGLGSAFSADSRLAACRDLVAIAVAGGDLDRGGRSWYLAGRIAGHAGVVAGISTPPTLPCAAQPKLISRIWNVVDVASHPRSDHWHARLKSVFSRTRFNRVSQHIGGDTGFEEEETLFSSDVRTYWL